MGKVWQRSEGSFTRGEGWQSSPWELLLSTEHLVLPEGLWRIQPPTQETLQQQRGSPRPWGTQGMFSWLNPVGRSEEIYSAITTRDASTGEIPVSVFIFPFFISPGRTGSPTNPWLCLSQEPRLPLKHQETQLWLQQPGG